MFEKKRFREKINKERICLRRIGNEKNSYWNHRLGRHQFFIETDDDEKKWSNQTPLLQNSKISEYHPKESEESESGIHLNPNMPS